MPEQASRPVQLRVRQYGRSGPEVVLLHGGPGAPGYLAPLARDLAGSFRVLEPLQRGSGGESLTVAHHVADLHELLRRRFEKSRPALVGHSWGAMLALAFAAAHPARVGSLVLVGCGTFDAASRELLERNRESRIDSDLRGGIERLEREVSDPTIGWPGSDGCCCRSTRTISKRTGWTSKPATRARTGKPGTTCSGFSRRCLPGRFRSHRAPGAHAPRGRGPSSGTLIEAVLRERVPQLEYREWQCCGHYPWLEKAVRQDFLAALSDWIIRRSPGKATV